MAERIPRPGDLRRIIGNLIVESKQTLSSDALKQKLIELCRQQGLEFSATTSARSAETTIRAFSTAFT